MGAHRATLVVMGFCALAGACSDEAVDAAGAGGAGGSAGSDPGVGTTWWEDVAPIVYDSCLGCHEEGGIAPHPLVTYGDARPVAGLMQELTADRTMPPWHADNTGSCQTYADARWLSDEAIATIAAWVEEGALEGDPANAPPLPGSTPALAEVSATLDMGVDYEPNGAIDDDYRCFIVDPMTTADQYLTAYQVKPGDPRVVHHVILFSLDTAQAEQDALQADGDDAGPGYTCFGGPGSGDSTFIAGWAPGTGATYYPEDTGVLIPGGRRMVMQIHYNTINGVLSDRTTIDVTLAANVARPATIIPVTAHDLVLPPGMERVEASNTEQNPAPIPVRVYGSYPHMHAAGVDLRVDLVRDGDDVCAIWVPRWDFNWQQFYFYEEPILALPTDLVTITCAYDTRDRESITTWGEGTMDEMCLNFVYVTGP